VHQCYEHPQTPICCSLIMEEKFARVKLCFSSSDSGTSSIIAPDSITCFFLSIWTILSQGFKDNMPSLQLTTPFIWRQKSPNRSNLPFQILRFLKLFVQHLLFSVHKDTMVQLHACQGVRIILFPTTVFANYSICKLSTVETDFQTLAPLFSRYEFYDPECATRNHLAPVKIAPHPR
jgi:hypothetical protein